MNELADQIAYAQLSGDWSFLAGLSLIVLDSGLYRHGAAIERITEEEFSQLVGVLNCASITPKAQFSLIGKLYMLVDELPDAQRAEVYSNIQNLLLKAVSRPTLLSQREYNVLFAAVDCLGRRYADLATYSILHSMSESTSYYLRSLACIGLQYLAVNTAEQSSLLPKAIQKLEHLKIDSHPEVRSDAENALLYVKREMARSGQ
jgi:hypothetical protein